MLTKIPRRMLQVLLPLAVYGTLCGGPLRAAEPLDVPTFEITRQQTIGDQRVRYRAVVEEVLLRDRAGNPTASIVATAYLRSDGSNAATRPLVFVFNGGPGSSSVWIHMGLAGPRRLALEDELAPPTTPPFALADNTESLLDVADLVLFDPPGTGFSRVLPGGSPEQFFGVAQDAAATVDFMRAWIAAHDRWSSPRFLMGESYGTVRAAVVAKLAAGGPTTSGGMEALTLNGIMMLGQALTHDAGELRYANELPTLAATAWFHDQLGGTRPELQAHLAAARRFAADDYVTALYAGDGLTEDRRRQVARQLATLTGLSEGFVLGENLRISSSAFCRELLQEAGLQVGIYDSRYTLPLAASGHDPVADDPAMGQYAPAFVGVINQYLTGELGVTLDRDYRAIDFRHVNMRWDYGSGPGVPANRNFAADLAVAMRRNPALRLFVASGIYDLATPAGSASYMASHSGLPAERVVLKEYASGHMPYLGDATRAALAADLRSFIRAAAAP